MPNHPLAGPHGAPDARSLLEVAHVAHRLGMGDEYVYQLIKDGKLAVVRCGRRLRIRPCDLEAFIDARLDDSKVRRVSLVDCTCSHEPDDHGWIECELDGCPCKGRWEE